MSFSSYALYSLIKFLAIFAGIYALFRTFSQKTELINTQKELRFVRERLAILESQIPSGLNKKTALETTQEKAISHKIVIKSDLQSSLSKKQDGQNQETQKHDKVQTQDKNQHDPLSPIAAKTVAAKTTVPSVKKSNKKSENTVHNRPVTTTANIDSAFGAKWSIWLGGISLALGSIFMMRYSLEQGLIGPGMRVIFGILLSAALLMMGEKSSKKSQSLGEKMGLDKQQSAYVPGVLTAAGIIAGFATIYGAYALYHFISPLIALILMAAMSIGALLLSAKQGPAIAALGLVGSYATPALVSTGHPNAWGLFTYLLFITLASFITAQMRGWLWLAISASVFAVGWGLLWFGSNWHHSDVLPMALYCIGLLGLSILFLKQEEPKWQRLQQKSKTALPVLYGTDTVLLGIMAAISALSIIMVRMSDYSAFSIGFFAVIIALLFASAYRWRSLTLLSAIGAGLFAISYITWDIERFLNGFTFTEGPLSQNIGLLDAKEWFLTVGVSFGAAIGLFSLWVSLTSRPRYIWTVVGAIIPLFVFAYSYLRVTNFTTSMNFGLIGLALTVAYALIADYLDKPEAPEKAALQSHNKDWAVGVYAAATVGALALSFTILMEKGWLTIALSLTTPALAWISLKRPVPALRVIAAGMAGIVAVRLFLDPRIVGENLGSTPIFNWLLYGYGVPAAAFALATWLMLKDKDDIFVQIIEATAIAFGTVLIALQVRHFMNNGVVFSHHFGLAELAIHTTIGLALSLGMQVMYKKTRRPLMDYASELIGMLGMASALLGLLLVKNPAFSNEFIGRNGVFNEITLAYLIPAILAGAIFYLAKGQRSEIYVKAAGITSLLLAFAYVTLQTRFMFHSDNIGLFARHTTNTENYAYSAVWLVFGGLILLTGIIRNKELLRYAGLPIIGLTILKVFLFDMASLDGILRAASFIGLGFALVGLGYLYQNYVIPLDKEPQP